MSEAITPKLAFSEQAGIGVYKDGEHWIDTPTDQRVSEISLSFFKLSAFAIIAGAITFLVVPPPISFFISPLVTLALIGIGTYLIRQSIHDLEAIKKASINPEREYDGPRLGEWSENEMIATTSGEESYAMKLALIEQAEQSIEISGSYCGGTVFNRALDLIAQQLKKKPALKVKIISNNDLLDASNHEKIAELAAQYPDRFFLLETKKQFKFFPSIKTEENHTKLLVIDGTLCMTGGTGIQDMLCRGEIQEGVEQSAAEHILGGAARDMDVVIKGPVAKTMRQQFYQLLNKWVEKTPEERRYGTEDTRYQPLQEGSPSLHLPQGSMDPIHSQTTMIAGSYEHGKAHECKLAYIQMIRQAQKSIVIANMCFNQPEIIEELRRAVEERGVKVTVVTNTNHSLAPLGMKIMGIVNRFNLMRFARMISPDKQELVQLYQFTKPSTLFHKKAMIVDEELTAIGSFNISLHCADTEDEDLVIFDSKEVAHRFKEILEQDIQDSRKISLGGFWGALKYYWNLFESECVLLGTANIFQ